MATKKAQAKSERRKGKKAGDPITVGGGGGKRNGKKFTAKPITIDFSHGAFPTQTSGSNKKKTFQSATLVMKTIKVYVNRVEYNLTDLLLPGGGCDITIKCKGSAEDLEMYGNKMGIRLHTGKYGEAGPHHESPDGGNFIKRVYVEGKRTFDMDKLTAADEVRVEADTI